MSNEAFSKGNAAFVEENYEEAIEWYCKAIDLDDTKADHFIKRAQAYIKTEDFTAALKDADTAIGLDAQNTKAYLRKGTAQFYLENFSDAKISFQAGQQIDGSEKQFSTWIRKCDVETKMASQDPSPMETQVGVAVGSEDSNLKKKISDTADKKEEISPPVEASISPTQPEEPAQPPEIPIPAGPKKRHDWYQTETHVIVTIMIKKVKKEDLHIDIQEKTVSVTLHLSSDNDYSLELYLLHSIVPEKSITKVLNTKVEIKLKKADGIRWTELEGDRTEVAKVQQVSTGPTTGINKYPSSSQHSKDWDKMVADLKAEEKDEKLEGDAALNNLFQKIYSDGSDDIKKAMNKSFAESGGTVLSTNWKEIGKDKVDIKAPDGMEWKKWTK